jgi:hypothetical protein
MTFRITADVPPNRQLVLSLPESIPPGRAELVVSVDSRAALPKQPRTSLAEWAEENAEEWGDRIRSDDVEGFTGRRF